MRAGAERKIRMVWVRRSDGSEPAGERHQQAIAKNGRLSR